MNLDSLIDFADEAHRELGRYQLTFTLPPHNITATDYAFDSLPWDSILYGEADIDKVPDDKRGMYAFAICGTNGVLPPHGYILYIGIAGRDSDRSLRARYKDYLNEHNVRKREGIARMIGDWHAVLRFFFAPVEDNVTSDQLKTLEEQLNTALVPPFSRADLSADTRRRRRAFP